LYLIRLTEENRIIAIEKLLIIDWYYRESS
jgi:hypothetical protein